MVFATLGGIPMKAEPEEIRWNFKIKTADQKTLGGKVIQVIGTTLGDISVSGSFGNGPKGKEGWERQLAFRDQVEEWADAVSENSTEVKSIKFVYPPRGWNFNVFVKSLSAISHTIEDDNPKYTVTLFPLDDGSAAIVRGIKDLYIKRLMDGVGWKQTAYNGPTQADVDDVLQGGSVADYMNQQRIAAFTQGVSGQAFQSPSGTAIQ